MTRSSDFHTGDCRCDECEAERRAWTSPDNELASLRAEVEKLKAENEKLRKIDIVNMDTLTGLNNECARLRTENAALRELVVDGYYEEFGDVQSEGAKKEVDRFWRKSTTKQRLDEIAKGEG